MLIFCDLCHWQKLLDLLQTITLSLWLNVCQYLRPYMLLSSFCWFLTVCYTLCFATTLTLSSHDHNIHPIFPLYFKLSTWLTEALLPACIACPPAFLLFSVESPMFVHEHRQRKIRYRTDSRIWDFECCGIDPSYVMHVMELVCWVQQQCCKILQDHLAGSQICLC